MTRFRTIAGGLLVAVAGAVTLSSAQTPSSAGPPSVLNIRTSALPKSDTHEVRMYVATIAPGKASPWHTHRSPPFVYVTEGAYTIESKTHPPIEVSAGQGGMEPPDEVLRAVNHGTVPVKIVVFYVAAPGMPFFDDVKE
jgi:quercetin dioxygenase-like cupin family protein